VALPRRSWLGFLEPEVGASGTPAFALEQIDSQ